MGRKGYLKFYRSMLNHPLWLAEPFTKGQAFWDLVARANHADAELLYGNTIVSVKRGQLFTSEVKLAERWQWSRNKVRRYLKLLESMKMSTATSTGRGTLITIENYSVYQSDDTARETGAKQGGEQKTDNYLGMEHEKNMENDTANETMIPVENYSTYQGCTADSETGIETPSGQDTEQGAEQQAEHKQEEIKKNKEELNNNIYSALGEFQNVSLSEEELEKLKERFPYDWQERIENLSAYMKSKGRRYKSHYATILNWARKESKDASKPANNAAKERDGSPAGTSDEYEKFFK